MEWYIEVFSLKEMFKTTGKWVSLSSIIEYYNDKFFKEIIDASQGQLSWEKSLEKYDLKYSIWPKDEDKWLRRSTGRERWVLSYPCYLLSDQKSYDGIGWVLPDHKIDMDNFQFEVYNNITYRTITTSVNDLPNMLNNLLEEEKFVKHLQTLYSRNINKSYKLEEEIMERSNIKYGTIYKIPNIF